VREIVSLMVDLYIAAERSLLYERGGLQGSYHLDDMTVTLVNSGEMDWLAPTMMRLSIVCIPASMHSRLDTMMHQPFVGERCLVSACRISTLIRRRASNFPRRMRSKIENMGRR